jgi:protocatechuate 3,4-dioxygenase beta subunit
MRPTLSRREVLEKCAAAGLLIVAPPLTAARLAPFLANGDQALKRPTPPNEMGPFYKRGAPRTTRLARAGDPGLPLGVTGKVYDVRGELVAGAVLEVWHTSHAGHYDNEGYRYRAEMNAGPKGEYAFESVMPGHYPGRVAQHVHFKVSAPGHRTLITQLYFATDPAFEGDPDRNYGKDPIVQSRELIRPVTIGGDPAAPRAAVSFELVLERA